MSDQSGATPPAAWYPDPGSADHYRWWDGGAWTAHVRDREVAPEPYVPMQYAAVDLEPVTAVVTKPHQGGPATLAILIFSLLPLILVVGPTLIEAVAPGTNDLVVQLVLSGVVIVASVIVAAWDGRAITSHGYPSWARPHPLYAIVPIAYLVRRMFSVGGITFVFVVIWAGASIASYTTQVGDLTTQATPSAPTVTDDRLNPPYSAANREFLLTPVGMGELVGKLIDSNGPVTCQPLGSVEAGAQTTCAATLPLGIQVTVIVQVQPAGANTVPISILSTTPNG